MHLIRRLICHFYTVFFSKELTRECNKLKKDTATSENNPTNVSPNNEVCSFCVTENIMFIFIFKRAELVSLLVLIGVTVLIFL